MVHSRLVQTSRISTLSWAIMFVSSVAHGCGFLSGLGPGPMTLSRAGLEELGGHGHARSCNSKVGGEVSGRLQT